MNIDINWIFGFNGSIRNSVHSLSTLRRNAIFYVSSQYGIIYDIQSRSQIILQGHSNAITCCSVSEDKKWIVTVDQGENSLLVVWDSFSGIPIKTIVCPHSDGVESVDISGDAMYISTIGRTGNSSKLAIWAWTENTDDPIIVKDLDNELQHHSVTFDKNNSKNLLSWGKSSISFWNWNDNFLSGYFISASKFDSNIGTFSVCSFLNKNCVVVCTSDGFIILWESAVDVYGQSKMKPSKVFKITETGICSVTTINEYLVLGCQDGSVRFYDKQFRLEAWFEDLCVGSVLSLSFSDQQTETSSKFECPDFVISTVDGFILSLNSSTFNQVLVENRRGTLLMQGVNGRVSSISCHSSKPIVAICCSNGVVQLWNYELKLLLNVRELSTHRQKTYDHNKSRSLNSNSPLCMSFQKDGDYLAIGFSNGTIKLLDSKNLADVATYVPSGTDILDIQFSHTSDFMACYDSDSHVILFKKNNSSYEIIGRIKSHIGNIVGISFGLREKNTTLISVGVDSVCVEYDLNMSSPESGILLIDSSDPVKCLDVASTPTAVHWSSKNEDEVEDKFIAAFTSNKFKEFDAESKHCRKTALQPISVNDIVKMVSFNFQNNRLLAYSSSRRVVGLLLLPLTGNPNKSISVAAHPSEVSDISVSFDGKYLFSAGGSDLSVNMWSIHLEYEALSTDEIIDYIELLDGGKSGILYNEIVDYFYYCQIRSQGENSMDLRDISGSIPVDQIANLMRALGFYPSEAEIENMVNEIRFKNFKISGEYRDSLTLDEVIRLYINYKPTKEFSGDSIVSAIENIQEMTKNNEIEWADLKHILNTMGEVISPIDLKVLLSSIEENFDSEESKLKIEKFVELLL